MPSQLDQPPWNEPLVDPRTGLISGRWRPVLNRLLDLVSYGSENWTTANRPTKGLFIGRHGFNTTTGKPEWWNGSAWTSY